MFKKLLMVLMFLPSLAFASAFVAGKDYQVLPSPQEKSAKPSVIEFFSYGCPWCYRIEKPLNQWLEEKDIDFQRVAVVFNKEWENYSKAYYTAKSLGLADKLSPLLFNAIQEENKPLSSNQKMIDFFVEHGVSREIAKSAFNYSPTIDLQVNEGMRLMGKYQVNAVPAFVVNKQYRTDLQMAQTPERLLKILNYLIKKPEEQS